MELRRRASGLRVQDQRLADLAANRISARPSARASRRFHAPKFFDEEAGVSSEDDMDGDVGEDDDIAAIESEEALEDGFINDSSQLGYTQDALDLADCDADDNIAHRELDIMRERLQERHEASIASRATAKALACHGIRESLEFDKA